MKQWILKEHTSFFLQTTWDLNRPVWELISSSPREEASQRAWSFGCGQGRLWARQPADCLAWSCRLECVIIRLPSQNASCPAGRPYPRRRGTTTQPSDKAMWPGSESWLGCSQSILVKAAGKQRESRSDTWVRRMGSLVTPSPKMRWCHQEHVSVLVLNSRRQSLPSMSGYRS